MKRMKIQFVDIDSHETACVSSIYFVLTKTQKAFSWIIEILAYKLNTHD